MEIPLKYYTLQKSNCHLSVGIKAHNKSSHNFDSTPTAKCLKKFDAWLVENPLSFITRI